LLTLISIVVPTSIPVAEGIKCDSLNILLCVKHSQRRDVACYVSALAVFMAGYSKSA